VIDFLDENDRNDDRKFEEQALIYWNHQLIHRQLPRDTPHHRPLLSQNILSNLYVRAIKQEKKKRRWWSKISLQLHSLICAEKRKLSLSLFDVSGLRWHMNAKGKDENDWIATESRRK
jgi:hypothetical protein